MLNMFDLCTGTHSLSERGWSRGSCCLDVLLHFVCMGHMGMQVVLPSTDGHVSIELQIMMGHSNACVCANLRL